MVETVKLHDSKRYLVVFLALILGGLLVNLPYTGRTVKAYNTENLIRFHVVANSDRLEDKRIKKTVRDAVAEVVGPMLTEADDVDEAKKLLQEYRESIKKAAEEALAGKERELEVKVRLGKHEFPAKKWGDLRLPAGEYQALRIVIGDGTGGNWWCVLFPPFCFLSPEAERREIRSSSVMVVDSFSWKKASERLNEKQQKALRDMLEEGVIIMEEENIISSPQIRLAVVEWWKSFNDSSPTLTSFLTFLKRKTAHIFR